MVMMELFSSRILFLFVLIILIWAQEDFAEGANGNGDVKNYISWEDFEVDELRLALNFRTDVRVIIVNKNGGGHSKTVQGAVDMVPDNNSQRVKIFIHPGIYREKVYVPVTKPYVSFIGKRNETASPVITWNSKSSDIDSNGKPLGTYHSATVGVDSNYFCATGVTFEVRTKDAMFVIQSPNTRSQNTVNASAGEKGMQAVALRVNSPKAMFYDVRIVGTQDTLLDNEGQHYFLKSLIIGKVDFICGNAKSLYEKCRLESIAENSGAIAAHHRNLPTEDTGFSFVRCSIRGTGNVYLGRAWGNYSRIIYSNCNIDDIINPEGWSDWNHQNRKKTAVFAEYQCKGKGADRRHRVPWSKSFNYQEAEPFLYKNYIDGHHWLRL